VERKKDNEEDRKNAMIINEGERYEEDIKTLCIHHKFKM